MILGGGGQANKLAFQSLLKFKFKKKNEIKIKFFKLECQAPRVIIEIRNIDFGDRGGDFTSIILLFIIFVGVPIYFAHDCLRFGAFEPSLTAFSIVI